jgi:hypothetical protein
MNFGETEFKLTLVCVSEYLKLNSFRTVIAILKITQRFRTSVYRNI